MTNKKITVKMLKKLHACEEGLEVFKDFCKEYGFSEGVEVTVENLKKADEYGLDIVWAICEYLIPVDIIIDSDNLRCSYYCLKCDIYSSEDQFNKLLNNVVSSGDEGYSYLCLKNGFYSSKGQFNMLVNIVINSGSDYYSHYCLMDVKGLSEEQKKALQANIK